MTQAQQPIKPELVSAIVTTEQYHQMVNAGVWDDRRVELLDGVVVEMPSEGVPHASDSSRTGDFLRDVLAGQAQIREGHAITLPNNSEPEPDLAIVHRRDDYYRSHHPYSENIFWLIEYSNTSLDKDLGVKADIYAAADIPGYWVVNLKQNILIVFRDPVDGKYQSRQELTSGVIAPLAFLDLAIDIARLLK